MIDLAKPVALKVTRETACQAIDAFARFSRPDETGPDDFNFVNEFLIAVWQGAAAVDAKYAVRGES